MEFTQIPAQVAAESSRQNRRVSPRTFGEYSWAVCSVYLLASSCFLILPWTGYVFSALVFLLAIVLAGLRWQRGPVLCMATMSALLWNFLFIPPKFTLHIEKPADAIMFVMFFMVALSMGHLTSRLHQREESLERQKNETQALLQVLQNSVCDLDPRGGFDAAVSAMKSIIGADLAVLLCSENGRQVSPHASSRFRPAEEEWPAVYFCAAEGKPAGRHMEFYSDLETSWLPIDSQTCRVGVVGFFWQEEAPPDFSTRRMMEALTLQLALIIERQQTAENHRRTELLSQSARLHKILFDSVSHELKTPIMVIRTALDGLDSNNPFVVELVTATQRLQRIVENFLEMSRMESEAICPRYDWVEFSDILHQARLNLGAEWPSRVCMGAGVSSLPLLRVDVRMTAQALANIVHNASIHSSCDAEIFVDASMEAGCFCMVVRDWGKGIPAGTEGLIFDKFYRAPGAPAGGTGLGLAIADGFIRAQGGGITARNHLQGGAEFEIRIPIATHPLLSIESHESGANH
jgi:two-component system sensor histidine kinase KdpD